MANAYATLTALKSASYLNLSSATTHDAYLVILLEMASRLIDKECRRVFYVYNGTRYYDGAETVLFFPDDILSITTFKLDEDADGTFETSLTETTDYNLHPYNEYPKMWAQVSDLTTATISNFVPDTKKAVQIVGSFGYGYQETNTPYLDSTVDVNTGGITAAATTHALASDKGASFAAGETILIGAEQLYITSISTDTLTFERAKNGTTAASHTAGDAIYTYQYPSPIVQATLITAMRAWKRKDSAYQDVVGYSELGTTIRSKGIDPDVARIIESYVREIAPK